MARPVVVAWTPAQGWPFPPQKQLHTHAKYLRVNSTTSTVANRSIIGPAVGATLREIWSQATMTLTLTTDCTHPDFTIADQIAEVERELAIRERVYARWVIKGKLTQKASDQQQGRLRAVRDTLRRAMVLESDRVPRELPIDALLHRNEKA